MTGRRRILVLVLIALVVLLLIALFATIRSNRKDAGPAPGPGASAAGASPESIAKRAAEAKTEGQKLKILSEAPRMLRGYVLAKASVVDVQLQAMVVDENGKGIEGATVYYNTGGGFLGGATGSASSTTDAEGRFVTQGKGSNVIIQAIVKDGYRVPVHAQGGAFIDNGGKDYESWASFTREKPKVFHAWKIPSDMVAPESLVKSKFDVALSLDGTRSGRSVELLGGNAVISTAPKDYHGLRNASIRLELKELKWREGAPEETAWSLTMSVANGGGFARAADDDEFASAAPEGGYAPTVPLAADMFPSHDRNRAVSFWYVYFGDYRRYCRLRLEIKAPRTSRDSPDLWATGFAACNPIGQRYLFPYDGPADW